jgi:hypothetical protein
MNDSRLNPFCKASRTLDLVTGENEYSRARDMRTLQGKCGPDAKLFDPKPISKNSKIDIV